MEDNRRRPATAAPYPPCPEELEDNRRRPATAAPYPPCPEELEDGRRRPVMSTPCPQSHGHLSGDMSTPGFPRPVCIEMSDTPAHHFTGPRQEGCPAHRPAAPIQRFNNKTIGWPAWFRHFKAVADVHGWDKNQRALQMVSYLDEKAMNVAQELTDRELYDYDVLVRLLSDRFDPASRVSASRSRFHGRRDAIRKTQTHTPMPSRSCVDWATHKAHRNFGKSSSANNSLGVSLTLN